MRKEEVKAAINAKESSNPPFEKPILWSDSFLRSFFKTTSEKIWAEKIEEIAQQKGDDEEAEMAVLTVAQ